MISFRLDALKFENLYKKLLPTISTFSYVSGQTKQVCPTVQPIRHTRHDCSFTINPTPNIFAGGENMHGRFEYVSLQTMERAVDTIIGIVTKK